MTIWTFIKADQFFPTYLPNLKNYKRKISKRDGRGNPVDFSPKEKKEIRVALKKMIKENNY